VSDTPANYSGCARLLQTVARLNSRASPDATQQNSYVESGGVNWALRSVHITAMVMRRQNRDNWYTAADSRSQHWPHHPQPESASAIGAQP